MSRYKSKYPGVRYREHPTRKHGKAPDRYFTIRYRYRGKEHHEGVGWSSQKVTAKKAAQLLAELQSNQVTGAGPVTLEEWRKLEEERRQQAERKKARQAELPQTFGELADIYISWAKGHKKSWNWDSRRVETYLRPQLGDKALADVETHHVESIKSRLQEQGRSASMITQVVGLVRRIYNHGHHLYGARFGEVAPHNPVHGIRLPKQMTQRIRYLSLEEVNKLLQVAKDKDPLMRDVIELALYTGMRRGEIASLTSGKVVLDKQIIYIPDPKSGRDEYVDIPDHLLPMLRDRVIGNGHASLVFPGRRGVTLNSVSHRFKVLADAAGLNAGVEDPRDQVVFHTLRHTFVSWLVLQGTDLRTVQEMARHRSLEMTMRYAHLAPSSKRHAANSLPQAGYVPSSDSESQGTGSASD